MSAWLNGIQSATSGAGLHDQQFNGLFLLFLGITGFFYLIVIVALIAAIILRRRRTGSEPLARAALFGWVGAVVVGLAVLSAASFLVDRRVDAATMGRPPLKIELVANQWWWDVRYHGASPSDEVHTANELHLPVGVPALVTLKSNDVIHSFWVPPLAGKQDLVPGRTNDILLLPRRTGLFRGQCAEFCGTQHARMALDVTVESLPDFRRWQRAQRAPAFAPRTALAQGGYAYVTQRECANCHNITGTPASGRFGPDLTHLASRRSIGAGTYPMTRGHLYAWVADPQGAKPGNNMPYIGFEAQDLHAVVAYLQSLK
ncbi:cytochrome c oxidase subunit II [Sphingobium sp. SCG-1]|uniref:cytochrome c oxidase subunit II n=1 Tax=Sphingobium sp. SCG-1 TaxID=2072936 RepID=UPI000CD6C0BA|nr:c-type cytochrome [Sphingobium sp. SCG-1]AUW57038.1 cytochrome c oxidase subunit II [Sphingobium sp. SCG-1]